MRLNWKQKSGYQSGPCKTIPLIRVPDCLSNVVSVVKKKEEGYRTASSYPSFSETTGSIDSQRSQTSTASLKRLKHVRLP